MPEEIAGFKLSAAQVNELKGLNTHIARAKYEIKRLQRVGIDTKALEQTLTDATKLRDDLISVYG